METVTNIIFLHSKITVNSDWSHEIKMLAPWKKSCNKPRQCIKKQRHHFANKGLYSLSYGFSSSHVCMWKLDHKEGCMRAEYPRADAFELWCWRRLLRDPWTARSIQSILKEINPEYSLEGLMLKLQYFGHLTRRTNSLEKTLMLGKSEGKRRGNRGRDGWMASLTQWTWVWANSRN